MIQAALAQLLDGKDLTRDEARAGDGRDHVGRRDAGADRRLPRRAAAEGRDARRDRRLRRGDARARRFAVQPKRDDLVDTAGTGGDGANTFNISTAAALVAAAAGAGVAKHGNRAASSRAGSADVLEALGFELDLPPERIADSIDELGFGFMFAQTHHPAMKHAAPVRRELATRTVFNVLGPLTNPAGARAQVVGVYSPRARARRSPMCSSQLGARRAFVVHGAGGIDELSPTGPNLVAEVVDGAVTQHEIDPLDLGVPRCAPEDLQAATRTRTRAIREVFAGRERRPALGESFSMRPVRSPRAGTPPIYARVSSVAREALDSGAAAARLEELIAFSQAVPRMRFVDALVGARASGRSRSSSGARRRRATCVRAAMSQLLRAPTSAPARARCRSSSTSASAARWDDLRAARAVTPLPLLAKGFFSTDEHLREARAAGADAGSCCSATSTTARCAN